MNTKVKWLYPGMRVKRWLLLVALGTLLFSAGVSLSLGLELFTVVQNVLVRPLARWLGALPQEASIALGLVAAALGLFLVAAGIRETIRSLISIFLPNDVSRLADIVFEQRQLKRGPKLVVIGGGTGLATLLRGLKEHTSNITAIVTTADDGGSSGRLRNELGIPPPGDIRNTLVALADTEPLMERLFQYRFSWGDGLKGHSFGNLFIAAMTEVTGDFEAAVRESSKVLAIRGRVLPSTLEEVRLHAHFADGTSVTGESAIPTQGKRIERISLSPKEVKPLQEALVAIEEADGIVLGPGSLYTSILPNLLVEGIAGAIKSSRATKIFVCNVMTQPGETDGYTASRHLEAICDHVGEGLVEYAVLNDAPIPEESIERYRREGAFPVEADIERFAALNVVAVSEPLIDQSDLVRHDPAKLAQTIMEILSATHPHFRPVDWRTLR